MRLPRKFTTALPRQEVISPGEAAAAAGARYETAATAFRTAGQIVTAKQELDYELEKREDENTIASIETDAKARLKQWETDPRYEMDVQEGGEATPDIMRQDIEGLYGDIMGRVDEIKNPVRREQFSRAMQDSLKVIDADIESAITARRMDIIKKTTLANAQDAAEIRDYDRAKELIESASSEFQDVADKKDELLEAVDELKIEHRASDLEEMADDAYAVSWERGEAFLDTVMRSDDEARDAAIDKISRVRTEWNKAYQQERQKRDALAIRHYGDDARGIAEGEITSEAQINASRDAGRYGLPNTPASEQRANQLKSQLVNAVRKRADVIDITTTIEAGEMILDDKKHREALDIYLANLLSGVPEEEHAQIIADTFRVAGTIGQNYVNAMNTSAKSQEALARWLPVYRELTEDQDRVPALHLSSESENVMESGARLMQAGMGAAEAAELAWKNRFVDDATKTVREGEWRDDVINTSKRDYKDLLDSDYYEEPGFGDSDFLPEMQAEYSAIYRESFLATGDASVAKTIADRRIKQNWVMSNLNDPDGEEYVVEKWGIPGDSSHLREQFAEGLQGQFKQFSDVGYVNRNLSPDEIDYRVMGSDGTTRIVVPHVNGRVVLDANNEVPEITVTADDWMPKQSPDHSKRIERINSEIRNLELLLTIPGTPAKREKDFRTKIEDLNRELEALGGV